VTDAAAAAPLILTLKLDPKSFARLDALRQAHFPPERNWLPAHLTLFHHLPGEDLGAVMTRLASARPEAPPMLGFTGLRRLGRGVAVTVHAPALVAMRAAIARDFAGRLTAQDQRPLQPHVTVQNKAEPEVAEALYAELSRTFGPWSGAGEGLLLWRYLGGPWRLEAELDWR
jgi:2'-5' RNA ligase